MHNAHDRLFVACLQCWQGGFKAVVWADVLQACVMVCGVTAIIVQGCINAGGFSEMLDVNRRHGRLTMFTSVTQLISE